MTVNELLAVATHFEDQLMALRRDAERLRAAGDAEAADRLLAITDNGFRRLGILLRRVRKSIEEGDQ